MLLLQWSLDKFDHYRDTRAFILDPCIQGIFTYNVYVCWKDIYWWSEVFEWKKIVHWQPLQKSWHYSTHKSISRSLNTKTTCKWVSKSTYFHSLIQTYLRHLLWIEFDWIFYPTFWQLFLPTLKTHCLF